MQASQSAAEEAAEAEASEAASLRRQSAEYSEVRDIEWAVNAKCRAGTCPVTVECLIPFPWPRHS